MSRLLLIAAAAALVGAPLSALMFMALVGPKAGMGLLHTLLAAAEARAMLESAAVVRVVAFGATARENHVWQSLLLDFASGEHPVAVDPVSVWRSAGEDAVGLFARLTEGSPNSPGEPTAAWAVHDFLIKNAQSESIPVDHLAPRIIALDRATLLAAVQRQPGWERVARQFATARAHVSFSRVGFSLDGRVALVYVDVYCGPLCGYGSYYVLRYEEGTWRRVSEQVNWDA